MHFFENVYFFLSMRTILGEDTKTKATYNAKKLEVGRRDASGRKELRNPKNEREVYPYPERGSKDDV
jgi:hypothetical protein